MCLYVSAVEWPQMSREHGVLRCFTIKGKELVLRLGDNRPRAFRSSRSAAHMQSDYISVFADHQASVPEWEASYV